MLDVIRSSSTLFTPEVTSAVGGLFGMAFQTVLLLLVAGLTWAVKLGLSSIKNGIVRAFAARAVAYAAQRLTNLSNEEKRRHVAGEIHKKFPRLAVDDIERFLEEAVINLKKGLA